jgi:hypothetical protein
MKTTQPWMLLGAAVIGACSERESVTAPTASVSRDAFVWKLSSSAAPAAGGTFTLEHLGDYFAGEYCERCVGPAFRAQWCNTAGTGAGWQVRNVARFTGERPAWVYIPGNGHAPDGYYADVCHDSTTGDAATRHTNDSAAAVIQIRTHASITGTYHTYTLTGNNRRGSSMGYVHASGCNADSTLLWSVADTSGALYGPFASPDAVVGPAERIVADPGALQFVREGFKPQCIPSAVQVQERLPATPVAPVILATSRAPTGVRAPIGP